MAAIWIEVSITGHVCGAGAYRSFMLKIVKQILRSKPKCRYCGMALPQSPSAAFCSRHCYDSFQYWGGGSAHG